MYLILSVCLMLMVDLSVCFLSICPSAIEDLCAFVDLSAGHYRSDCRVRYSVDLSPISELSAVVDLSFVAVDRPIIANPTCSCCRPVRCCRSVRCRRSVRCCRSVCYCRSVGLLRVLSTRFLWVCFIYFFPGVLLINSRIT